VYYDDGEKEGKLKCEGKGKEECKEDMRRERIVINT
jgi:hypothetical protein